MTSVFAHRGASATQTENTVAAFAAAVAMGADGVELDVRRTADGALAVHHDAHLPDGRLLCEVATSALPSHVPSLAERDGTVVRSIDFARARVPPSM